VLVQLLDRISEDEMIDVFIRGELESPRWREKILALGELDARTLLEQHRAYERREGLFLFFPREVDWFRAVVTRDELLDIRYINWDWWLEVSDGTRDARVAARKIRAGEIPGVTAEEHDPRFDFPLIAAATPELSPLVLVEGHARLTACALFPERVPDEVEILLGVSDRMAEWCQW
jgi:hypothetical protein